MSTVKISELSPITAINANTANTLLMGVDIPTGVTGKFTAHTLAQGLYSNEVLNVGGNPVTLPNTVAQFALSGQSYVQTNLVNTNDGGSADIVVTANTGTDSTYFIDVGYVNKDYEPGSEYNNIGTAVNRLDGYIYAQGSTSNTWGGNLIVGSTTTGKEVRFIAGGGSTENVVARMNTTSIILNRNLVFADGSSQNTAVGVSAAAYANAAFIQANAVYAQSNTNLGINLTQNTSIASAFTQANSSYTKANNALANTTGTFAGDLTLTGNLIAAGIQSTSGPISTGNLIVNGTTNVTGTTSLNGIVTMNAQVVLTNTTFSNTQSALTIAASNTVALPSQDGYMIHISGKQNVSSRIVTDSYGANTYVVYAGRSARGNVTNPTAVQSGDVLSRFSGNGYGTTKYQPFGTGRIDFVASENYTDANTGSQIQFWNCPVGSNTLQQIASFNGASVTFTGVVNPAKGFIYTPTVYPGAQTAITIDFANNSILRAQTATGLTVSFTNYTPGKVVELWITNTAGNGQTFTHGVAGINSTTNSTTYNIPATSTILARYMCFDGDLANTFVSVIHA